MNTTQLENGKYTIVRYPDGSMECLRHGEHWRELTGDKMVGALVDKIDELENELRGLTDGIQR